MGLGEAISQAFTSGLNRMVAAALSRPDDLVVLAMSIDISQEKPRVRFRLELTPQARIADPVTLDQWDCPTADLGIPARIAPNQQEIPSVQALPPELAERLKSKLPSAQSGPLWLKFEKPAGYLVLMAWERLLRPVVDRPVLRMVDLDSPRISEIDTTLEVAIVASEPRAKSPFDIAATLPPMVRAILQSGARKEINVHVFADAQCYHRLAANLKTEARVQVHQPPEAAAAAEVEDEEDDDDSVAVTAPESREWLPWVCEAMQGRAIDVLHFVCHGYLRSDQGWLALAESPSRNEDTEWSRFVGAAALTRSLVGLGAWSVVFTSPPGNFSRAGLRHLANKLADLRPGPVLVHEGEDDLDGTQLAAAYKFLYEPGPDYAPNQSSLSMYCHPSLVRPTTPASRLRLTLEKAVPSRYGFESAESVSEARNAVLAYLAEAEARQGAAPSWVAAAQRYIELRSYEIKRREREIKLGLPGDTGEIDRAKKALDDVQNRVRETVRTKGAAT